jgi:dTDP-glucose pyrophosphorylase/CBS domain-containing protein
MTFVLSDITLVDTNTIQDAIMCFNNYMKGIVLIVDDNGVLVNTLTDGDIRRATLEGFRLSDSLAKLLHKKVPGTTPVTAPPDSSDEHLLGLMTARCVQQIPLTDQNGKVVGLKTLPDLVPVGKPELEAVIMAGGFGTRLHPLTKETPKPMLPLGGRPLLQHTLDKLKKSGIRRVHISTHHLAGQIKEHFGDGRGTGLDIEYVSEDQPLGTAGALGLMGKTDQPLLVINGDIVTELDFRAMYSFHQEHRSDMTVGVRQFDIQVPYGVLKSSGPIVQGLEEKPVYTFMVNAGIYLLSPSVYAYIPRGKEFDMTDLISLLIEGQRTVTSFPVLEYWLDVGQHADYEKAQEDLEKGVFRA